MNKHFFRPRLSQDMCRVGCGWLGDSDCFSLYVEGKGRLAIHVRRYGGLPSKTTRTDRTIVFIIKVHYEEQT